MRNINRWWTQPWPYFVGLMLSHIGGILDGIVGLVTLGMVNTSFAMRPLAWGMIESMKLKIKQENKQ